MSEPLTVVCWRWTNPGYRSKFGPDTVRVLRNMVQRHYKKPHRFVCVTDTPQDIGNDIETIPLWKDFGDVQSPYGRHQPSCYRRLKAFSPEIGNVFGPRFVSLDLDTVIVRDITPLWDRPEDFIIWQEQDPRSYYNGSMFMMTAGARPQVWDRFNPLTTPKEAKGKGFFGSDQGVISLILGPGEAKWNRRDGVYSFRVDLKSGERPLPSDARITMWHGGIDPWMPRAQRLDWVRRNYH